MDKNNENINLEVKNIWNNKASFWDEKFGQEGNIFHRTLLEPAQLKLLDIKKDNNILDIACGNGHFSRRMAREGARVIAFDLSEKFIEKAIERSRDFKDRIIYLVIDATHMEKLVSLSQKRFDGAVCTMALMDMVDIVPLIKSLTFLLKKGAPFVFSVSHPCFNSSSIRKVIEEETVNGELTNTYSVKVLDYITSSAKKGTGILGEPEPHYYFHRPLSELFNICFKEGFVMDCMEEPVFPKRDKPDGITWLSFHEIPPAIVVRMRNQAE